jgi:hypothetical protein
MLPRNNYNREDEIESNVTSKAQAKGTGCLTTKMYHYTARMSNPVRNVFSLLFRLPGISFCVLSMIATETCCS